VLAKQVTRGDAREGDPVRVRRPRTPPGRGRTALPAALLRCGSASTPARPTTTASRPTQLNHPGDATGSTSPARARAGPSAPSTSTAAKRTPPHHSTDPNAPESPTEAARSGPAAVRPRPNSERPRQARAVQAQGQPRGHIRRHHPSPSLRYSTAVTGLSPRARLILEHPLLSIAARRCQHRMPMEARGGAALPPAPPWRCVAPFQVYRVGVQRRHI